MQLFGIIINTYWINVNQILDMIGPNLYFSEKEFSDIIAHK